MLSTVPLTIFIESPGTGGTIAVAVVIGEKSTEGTTLTNFPNTLIFSMPITSPALYPIKNGGYL